MKILVTGSSGFIGTKLCNALMQCGHAVAGFDIKEGNDITSMKKMPDADCVMHLAALISVVESWQNPYEYIITNILGTQRVCESFAGKKIIYASSGGTISGQLHLDSPYAITKECGEKFVNMYSGVVLRLGNVYGHGSTSVIEKFEEQDKLIIDGDGLQEKDFVHVDDIVRCLIQSLHWESGTYNVGTGIYTSILSLAQKTGKPYTFTNPRKGDPLISKVGNTTPDWQPKIFL